MESVLLKSYQVSQTQVLATMLTSVHVSMTEQSLVIWQITQTFRDKVPGFSRYPTFGAEEVANPTSVLYDICF